MTDTYVIEILDPNTAQPIQILEGSETTDYDAIQERVGDMAYGSDYRNNAIIYRIRETRTDTIMRYVICFYDKVWRF